MSFQFPNALVLLKLPQIYSKEFNAARTLLVVLWVKFVIVYLYPLGFLITLQRYGGLKVYIGNKNAAHFYSPLK